jgi:hypothetical protein
MLRGLKWAMIVGLSWILLSSMIWFPLTEMLWILDNDPARVLFLSAWFLSPFVIGFMIGSSDK